MKIVFMGTPDFATLSLEQLARKHEVVAVFTQVDKEKGRGKKVQMTAVKQKALALNLPVYQFPNVNKQEVIEKIAAFHADVIVVAAFGQILKEPLLQLTPYGCINIHASYLPRWRGASPIQTAIAAGDTISGVSIMQMDKGLDTGDILKILPQEISSKMTGGELHDALAIKGAKAILEVLEELENGCLTAKAQDESKASYAPMITKEMRKVDWSRSAEDIVNLIRAYNPFPTAISTYDGQRIKLFSAESLNANRQGKNGEIVSVSQKDFVVQAGEGQVKITELQFAGSKKMSVAAYLRGHEIKKTIVLT